MRLPASDVSSDDIDHRQDDHGSDNKGPSDAAILNFALNLEYLEAEFYLCAVTGMGLADNMTGGQGDHGDVLGGRAVPFATGKLRKMAEEIAADERAHVAFLREALGGASKVYLEAAAGTLAVEAYHAATIRSSLYALGLDAPPTNISDLRDSVDGPTDLDQYIVVDGNANIVPTDSNGIVFSRSAAQVLNIVYLTAEETTSGRFFPEGVSGEINTSGQNK